MAEGGEPCSAYAAPFEHDPTENLKMQPKKSILKAQPSLDEINAVLQAAGRKMSASGKEARFDEMNVIATLHPPDKDYGHMKIDEPKTPYNNYSDSEEDQQTSSGGAGERTPRGTRRVSLSNYDRPTVLAQELTQRMEADGAADGAKTDGGQHLLPKVLQPGEESDEESDREETEEQKAHRLEFEKKRKAHYNEGLAMRKAKELLRKEMEELNETDDGSAQTRPDVPME